MYGYHRCDLMVANKFSLFFKVKRGGTGGIDLATRMLEVVPRRDDHCLSVCKCMSSSQWSDYSVEIFLRYTAQNVM